MRAFQVLKLSSVQVINPSVDNHFLLPLPSRLDRLRIHHILNLLFHIHLHRLQESTLLVFQVDSFSKKEFGERLKPDVERFIRAVFIWGNSDNGFVDVDVGIIDNSR